MFINKDNRYGEGLTEEQIQEFQNFINNLDNNSKINLCESCHTVHGCKNDHDINLTDTGLCGICGKLTDVINCAIANKVEKDNIPVMSYFCNGKRLTGG